jgi:hypothetical protein
VAHEVAQGVIILPVHAADIRLAADPHAPSLVEAQATTAKASKVLLVQLTDATAHS